MSAQRPSTPKEWYVLGRKLAAAKRIGDAEKAFRKAVELDETFADAWIGLGAILSARGDAAGAEEAYRQATRVRPDLPDAWYFYGKLLKDGGNDSGAEEALRMGLDIAPPDWKWRERVSTWLSELVKKKMLKPFETVGLGDDHELVASVAVSEPETKAPDSEGFRIDLGYSSARDRLAAMVGMKPDNVDAGPTDADQPVSTTPGAEQISSQPFESTLATTEIVPPVKRTYHEEGARAIREGRLDDAQEILREGTFHSPTPALVWLELGKLQFAQKRTVDASASFQAVKMLDPSNQEVEYYRALLLIEAGHIDMAKPAVEAETQRDPSNAEAWVNLAGVFNARGNPSGAMSALERALEVAPNNWPWLDAVTSWMGTVGEGNPVNIAITPLRDPAAAIVPQKAPAPQPVSADTPPVVSKKVTELASPAVQEAPAKIPDQPAAPAALPGDYLPPLSEKISKSVVKKVAKAEKALSDAVTDVPKIKPGDKKGKAKEVQYFVVTLEAFGKAIALFTENYPLRQRAITLIRAWDKYRTEEDEVRIEENADVRNLAREMVEITHAFTMWAAGELTPIPKLSQPHYEGPIHTIAAVEAASTEVPVSETPIAPTASEASMSATQLDFMEHVGTPPEASDVASEVPKTPPKPKIEVPNKCYLEGIKCIKQQKYDEAEKQFRKAVKKDPTHVKSWTELGNILSAKELNDEAEEAYLSALDKDPGFVDAWFNYGQLLVAMGRIDDAEGAFRAATQQDPAHADAWTNLGGIWKALERFEDAEEAFRKALEEAPEAWPWTEDVIQWTNDLIETNESEPLGSRVSKFSKGPEEPGEGIEGEADFVPMEPDMVLINAAKKLAQAGNLLGAEEKFREATETNPDNPDAWVGLAISLKAQQRFKESKEAFQLGFNKAPDDWEWRDKVVEWLQEVDQHIKQEAAVAKTAPEPEPAELTEEKEPSSEIQPPQEPVAPAPAELAPEPVPTSIPSPAPASAPVPVAIEPPEEVGSLAPKPVATKPVADREGAMGLYHEGRALAGQGQMAAAEEKFREAVNLDTTCAEAWTGLGVVLKAQNRDQEAETAYQTAVANNPSYADGWYYLGILLQTSGRSGAAKQAYQRAVGVADHDWPFRDRVIEWISKL